MEEVGEANYPGYVGVLPGGENRFERTEETVNYEIGETVQRTITAPGKVLRMHTSVVVDTGQSSLNPENVEQVNALVSAAIGFDAERGDQISVQGMSFDRSMAEKIDTAMAEMEEQLRQEEMFRQAVLGGAAVLTFILLVVALLRRRRLLRARQLAVPEGPSLEELLAFEEKEELVAEISPEETPQGRARKMVDTNPDVAVAVLRSWMVED